MGKWAGSRNTATALQKPQPNTDAGARCTERRRYPRAWGTTAQSAARHLVVVLRERAPRELKQRESLHRVQAERDLLGRGKRAWVLIGRRGMSPGESATLAQAAGMCRQCTHVLPQQSARRRLRRFSGVRGVARCLERSPGAFAPGGQGSECGAGRGTTRGGPALCTAHAGVPCALDNASAA